MITNKKLSWKLKKVVRNALKPQVTPHAESLGVGFRVEPGAKR